MKRILAVATSLVLVSADPPAQADEPERPCVVGVYRLPQIALGSLLGKAVPSLASQDHGLLLGLIGSDLAAVRGQSAEGPQSLWMISDRGPNGQAKIGGSERRTFPTPEFNPLLLRVALDAGTIKIAQVLPIVGRSG